MTAYYNEHDALKAEVLREAIKAGAIAPGDVDERSIADVRGSDLAGYTQCHFFAGGGFWSLALRWAGWPDSRPAWTGSCPCPSFSCAGKGGGFDDPRHLWPHWARLVGECKPPVVFGEQADDAVGYGWADLVQTDLEAQAYAFGKVVFGAHSVGAPHIRQRLYFVADTAAAGSLPSAQRGLHGGEESAGPRTSQSERPRDAGKLEHAARRGCGVGWDAGEPGRGGHADGADLALRMGDADGLHTEQSEGKRAGAGGEDSGRAFGEPSGSGAPRIVADAAEGGRQPIADARPAGVFGAQYVKRRCQPEPSHSGSSASLLADADGEQEQPTAARRLHSESGECGPLRGFWADADWIPCRNPKVPGGVEWRPAQPGTFPLAHGYPNRVGILRLAGDAIVVSQAQAWIETYCEARGLK